MKLLVLRPVLLATAAFALASCYSGGSSGPSAPRQQSVTGYFSATERGVIQVDVTDPLPVAAASLIGPDGTAVAAYQIDRDREVYRSDGSIQPSVGVGVTGGSSSRIGTGIGIGFPLFGSGDGTGVTAAVTASRVLIRVPDLAVYGTSWQRSKLHIELDDGVTHRVMELLPPPPPQN
jgi:hypothetical protein